jgi:uncharacterized tellurite resistance protein B-like protein
MVKDAFEARRKSFEEEYFRKKDAQLVDKLKGVFHRKLDKETIRQTTGIMDERVLTNLVTLSLSGELMAAFKLYPLIEMAWADGVVDQREARAVLAAAEQTGIAPASAPYAMLENALKNRPREAARQAWYLFAAELRRVLNPQELAVFRTDLLNYAHRVAEASGGLLNMAFTISANEKRVLEAIERALTHEAE